MCEQASSCALRCGFLAIVDFGLRNSKKTFATFRPTNINEHFTKDDVGLVLETKVAEN